MELLRVHLKIKDVCDLVIAYAHEVQGTSHYIKLPLNVKSVAEITANKLAMLSFQFELCICDFVQTRKLAVCSTQSSTVLWWCGKLLVQSGCEVISHDPDGVEPPTVFCRVESPAVMMVGFADVLILAHDEHLTVVDREGRFGLNHAHGSRITRISKLDDDHLAVYDGHYEVVYTPESLLRVTSGHCPKASGELVMTHTQGSITARHSGLQRTIYLPCETYISCAIHGGKFAFYRSREVMVYDIPNNYYIELQQPSGVVHQLFELPDGRLAGLYDKWIAVWDWATGNFSLWPIKQYIITKLVTMGRKIFIFYHNQIMQIIE
jgi:hypothetical protein